MTGIRYTLTPRRLGILACHSWEIGPQTKMKTVQNVKNSLKFKATEKEATLSIKVGTKKYSVPFKLRTVAGEGYLFLSYSASTELFQTNGDELVLLDKDADATEAFERLSQIRRPRAKREPEEKMPDELASALRNVPAGFKLGYGPDGTPRLVKTRVRKSK